MQEYKDMLASNIITKVYQFPIPKKMNDEDENYISPQMAFASKLLKLNQNIEAASNKEISTMIGKEIQEE